MIFQPVPTAHVAPSQPRGPTQARVHAELRALFHQSPYPALANVAVAAVLVVTVWDSQAVGVLIPWLGAMIGACALRLWCRRAASGQTRRPVEPARVDRLSRISVAIMGGLWALIGAAVHVGTMTPLMEALAAIAVGGMLAGAMFSLTPDPVAFRLYALPAAIGPIVGFAAIATPEHVAAAAMGAVYTVVVLTSGHRAGRTMEREIRLRLENEALVAELAAARDGAALAERLKSNSFAIIGHEFRSPLNAISGFADSIRCEIWGPVGDARYRDYAARIVTSAQHLDALANSVLDLGRSEYGALTLTVAPIALSDVIESCRDILAGLSGDKGVAIQVETGAAPPVVQGDETKLRQVLINLVANALRFTPSGGTVTIALTPHPVDGTVELSVSDTGAGMAREMVQRVFEPFAAAWHEGKKDEAPGQRGTGLGLALSKRLVELHGGRIELESAPGDGTTVRIFLPAAETDPED